MMKLMLVCCEVYISESQNRTALEAIEKAARLHLEASIINKFEDVTYRRVGYTRLTFFCKAIFRLMLKRVVLAMVKANFESINRELHCGSHPRLGVVDLICFHHLACASLDQTTLVAKSLAADIGSSLEGLYL
ncbi:formimidoyltransferase-cyclodeaminase-like isoform X1 [Tripterygium wilfordii]|uniref:Formimidoyltransferase-cyclodeaminase-like isoform X1 n=1 Tax=Tripterygium wilfordii TaxID=458696 RepID=A0A7J7D551_TRIWF|nr:formimidoyltransferase-cyclodeaminase-like isoform X1 [Tripterygium wilfordii]